jgi:hypothetical protein
MEKGAKPPGPPRPGAAIDLSAGTGESTGRHGPLWATCGTHRPSRARARLRKGLGVLRHSPNRLGQPISVLPPLGIEILPVVSAFLMILAPELPIKGGKTRPAALNYYYGI